MAKYAFYEHEIDSIGVTNITPVGTDCVEIGDHIDPNDLYIKDGLIKVRSNCPGEYHSFDISSESWIDDSLTRLPEIKSKALRFVGEECSKVRSLYITDISGQEMIYTMKRDEAVAYLNDSDPILSDYPLISAEIGVTATTAYEVAQTYINMSAIFTQALSALENIRLIAVSTIEDATEKTGVDTALDNFSIGLSTY